MVHMKSFKINHNHEVLYIKLVLGTFLTLLYQVAREGLEPAVI